METQACFEIKVPLRVVLKDKMTEEILCTKDPSQHTELKEAGKYSISGNSVYF